mmetsp:Transcript_7887/g.19192  ORF Transcript_7887/g.19192 Transcript_7887/m.19192 type:complete len:244 (+) Transcript_7887:536-1267(+)
MRVARPEGVWGPRLPGRGGGPDPQPDEEMLRDQLGGGGRRGEAAHEDVCHGGDGRKKGPLRDGHLQGGGVDLIRGCGACGEAMRRRHRARDGPAGRRDYWRWEDGEAAGAALDASQRAQDHARQQGQGEGSGDYGRLSAVSPEVRAPQRHARRRREPPRDLRVHGGHGADPGGQGPRARHRQAHDAGGHLGAPQRRRRRGQRDRRLLRLQRGRLEGRRQGQPGKEEEAHGRGGGGLERGACCV